MVGPIVQDDLLSIILRFRTHKYVLTADVEKMYRQIWIHEEDTNYQKILWRFSREEPVQCYKLKTVTYGTSPAPYLATKCLQQLAFDEGKNYPKATKVLMSDFYMDDLLTGANTLSEALELRNQLSDLLSLGKFKLRKWLSNSEELLRDINNSSNEPLLTLNMSTTTKTLGLQWNASSDTINYAIGNISEEFALTKRMLLSQISRLFDPLGLVGPILIKAKILMQQLWQLKIDWDEQLPKELTNEWQLFKNGLCTLNELQIPRQMISPSCDIQLHGFSDAFSLAYGACIYLRSKSNENTTVHLVCGKSRVAPLKRLTIPRLELCAAELLSHMYQIVKNSLNLKIDKTVLWSDSTITLHWINSEPHKLKTFVGNRVAKIQEATRYCEWRHITSENNPADAISRGLLPSEIVTCNS